MDKNWRVGTLVKKMKIADNVMSLVFSLPGWQPFKAGQHFDIRLTAKDGYQAERSYSIGSAPEDTGVIEYGVQLLDDGEVSPYLWNLEEGRQVEMRGPIGGHFIWDITMPGPLILIGGGSGMVPLMSMLRHHMNNLDKDTGRKIVFIISARALQYVLYKEELDRIRQSDPNISIIMTITDNPPADWKGYSRRIDKDMLQETVGALHDDMAMTYICGPTTFVEVTAQNMIGLGFSPHSIKTERFGG